MFINLLLYSYVFMLYSQSSNLLNSSRLKILKAREDHVLVGSYGACFFWTVIIFVDSRIA